MKTDSWVPKYVTDAGDYICVLSMDAPNDAQKSVLWSNEIKSYSAPLPLYAWPKWVAIIREATEVEQSRHDDSVSEISEGGPGSGHHGHRGIPGQKGGSLPASGGMTRDVVKNYVFDSSKVFAYENGAWQEIKAGDVIVERLNAAMRATEREENAPPDEKAKYAAYAKRAWRDVRPYAIEPLEKPELLQQVRDMRLRYGLDKAGQSPASGSGQAESSATATTGSSNTTSLEKLASTPPSDSKPLGGGVNASVAVTWSDGTKAVFKTDSLNNKTAAEIIAYRLAQKLGMNNMPETVIGTLDGKTGSLQKWVPNASEATNIRAAANKALFGDDEHMRAAAKTSVLDIIIGNADRHPGNYMIDQQGKMWAIDHGLAGIKGRPRYQRYTDSERIKSLNLGFGREDLVNKPPADSAARWREIVAEEVRNASRLTQADYKEIIAGFPRRDVNINVLMARAEQLQREYQVAESIINVESVDLQEEGTADSGHRGHRGIPGYKGGSLPASGGVLGWALPQDETLSEHPDWLSGIYQAITEDFESAGYSGRAVNKVLPDLESAAKQQDIESFKAAFGKLNDALELHSEVANKPFTLESLRAQRKADESAKEQARKPVTEELTRVEIEKDLPSVSLAAGATGAGLNELRSKGAYIYQADGAPLSDQNIAAINNALDKIPAGLLKQYQPSFLFVNAKLITDYPKLNDLGKTPIYGRGKDEGVDSVQGVCIHPNTPTKAGTPVIAIGEFRDSRSLDYLVLHETGHALETALPFSMLPASSEWRGIWKGAKWDSPYTRGRANEAWAHSFENYYNSDFTRSSLPKTVQAYFDKVDAHARQLTESAAIINEGGNQDSGHRGHRGIPGYKGGSLPNASTPLGWGLPDSNALENHPEWMVGIVRAFDEDLEKAGLTRSDVDYEEKYMDEVLASASTGVFELVMGRAIANFNKAIINRQKADTFAKAGEEAALANTRTAPQLLYSPKQESVQYAKDVALTDLEAYGFSKADVPKLQSIMNREAALPLCRRDYIDAAEKIVADGLSGRWKTQFETGTTGGRYDPKLRLKSEESGLGVPNSVPAGERPIYGYFHDDGKRAELAAQYGNVRFVLKDTVKQRSTLTLGDSLGPFAGIADQFAVGTPAMKPGIEGADSKAGEYLAGRVDAQFTEAQIQGGLRLGDVQKVVIHRATLRYQQEPERYQRLTDNLKALGISVEYEDKWE